MAPWQSYKCSGLNYEMLVIESLDADTETRRLSPVAVLGDGYVDLLNGTACVPQSLVLNDISIQHFIGNACQCFNALHTFKHVNSFLTLHTQLYGHYKYIYLPGTCYCIFTIAVACKFVATIF